ncbi:MAG: hypothetical protein DWQ04_12385 [Chloroflexi bacterium]|nr:MAG: hypothetical protein DWQ04_12385 [Chloroflexota bacterium]
MSKNISAFYRANSLEEALELLNKPDTKPIGGGAHLLSTDVSCAVIDLQDLGLNQIEQQNDALVVGGTTRLAELAAYLADQDGGAAELLADVIHKAGPNTYRNAATVAGTLARRLPDSEWLSTLLAFNATVTLHNPNEITLSVADYLAEAERPFGIITHLTIPMPAGQGSTHRVARTPADYPIVSVTGWQPEGGAVALAVTGLGKRPFRLLDAETAVTNQINADTISAAANTAKSANQHPGDFRGDAAYRAEMASTLTRRVLETLT